MQFTLIGLDAKDESALSRRMAARPAHLALAAEMQEQKRLLYACALLDDAERMVGTIMILDFSSREELDNWLKVEPYKVGNVWEKIEIRRCQVPAHFLHEPVAI